MRKRSPRTGTSAIGIGAAIRAVLQALPPGACREHISLVSVSTTLATNAVVENRFSPICTLLIGFDDAMVERSGLEREGGGVIVRLRGGHDASGDEAEPLDEAAVAQAVREFASQVEAFAVAANCSRCATPPTSAVRTISSVPRRGKPVTCSSRAQLAAGCPASAHSPRR